MWDRQKLVVDERINNTGVSRHESKDNEKKRRLWLCSLFFSSNLRKWPQYEEQEVVNREIWMKQKMTKREMKIKTDEGKDTLSRNHHFYKSKK